MKEIGRLLAQLHAEEIRKCYHKITIYNTRYDKGTITSSIVTKNFYLYLINWGKEFLKIQLPCQSTLTCKMLINLIKENGVTQRKELRLSTDYRTQNSKERVRINLKDVQCYFKNKIQSYEENRQTTVCTAYGVVVNHIKTVTNERTKIHDSSIVYQCEIIDQDGNRMIEREKDGLLDESQYLPSVLDRGKAETNNLALEIRRGSKKLLCINANVAKKIFEIFLDALKAEYIVSKTSFLHRIKLGQKILNPFVSISINSVLPTSSNVPVFDDEGNPICEKMLVQNGLLVNFINSTDYAETSDRAIGCLQYNYETEQFGTGYYSSKISIDTQLEEHCVEDAVFSAIRDEYIYFDVQSGQITLTLDGFFKKTQTPCYYTISENIADFINRIVSKKGDSIIVDNMEACNILFTS